MKIDSSKPKYLLFAQHGWADTGDQIGNLASSAADSQTLTIAPSLGWLKTFIRIQHLVRQLENIAKEVIQDHPETPIKILGHSMGGLIWLEVLNRNPQWWNRVHSFILLGSPVGGSNIARIIDPLGIGIGTAGDLGKNRRSMAAKIAQKIPLLSVASDIGMGTDGLVTLENTKFDYGNWLLISSIAHSAMRYDPRMIPIIQEFWANPNLGDSPETTEANQLIQRLRSLPGMTDADYHDLKRSQIVARFTNNLSLRKWDNPWRVSHVYLCQEQRCLYAGYVGWLHIRCLNQFIQEIQQRDLCLRR
ncbi:MAG: alpha/beta hydrolase [Cyanobacteria bacterium P01_G01_bin.39]